MREIMFLQHTNFSRQAYCSVSCAEGLIKRHHFKITSICPFLVEKMTVNMIYFLLVNPALNCL